MIDVITTYSDRFYTEDALNPVNMLDFAKIRVDSKGVAHYMAPSLNSDLAGRPILKRMATRTRAGIVSRALHITLPVLTAGKYDSSIQARVVLNAPYTANLALCGDTLYQLMNCFREPTSGFVDCFADEFIRAADLVV